MGQRQRDMKEGNGGVEGKRNKQRQTKTKKATKKKDDWLENVKLQKGHME